MLHHFNFNSFKIEKTIKNLTILSPPFNLLSKAMITVVVFHCRFEGRTLSSPTYATPLISRHKYKLESSSIGSSFFNKFKFHLFYFNSFKIKTIIFDCSLIIFFPPFNLLSKAMITVVVFHCRITIVKQKLSPTYATPLIPRHKYKLEASSIGSSFPAVYFVRPVPRTVGSLASK